MNYSTLKEAYSVDTFEREKKSKSKKKHRNETIRETFSEQDHDEDDTKSVEDIKPIEISKKVSLATNKEILDEKTVKPFYDEDWKSISMLMIFKKPNLIIHRHLVMKII